MPRKCLSAVDKEAVSEGESDATRSKQGITSKSPRPNWHPLYPIRS